MLQIKGHLPCFYRGGVKTSFSLLEQHERVNMPH
ncbi:hypothetical protein EHW99_2485 [Erwinia amylovora]|uniref:Uncharacterized protein n=3 Tax=Erwinia amylovora TaxID=552 RepID=A0A831EQ72_ERWAM|nr:hypothetical protein EaACW_1104 [Erwinia amylovora ACW56400]QJQ55187.1 hypothetical protein EHX00_2485 [Erwinia amylovora]CBA20045.1 hypothetical protein predicted by Glimmer/Critica [Erwinia amylovora CFBP1430]CBX79944.1 hypothetical protein predicted by Glimmer/Critica [Erwinia amylovora ATCC BAA-2158]CCO77948.1 hypothetical protein BN432_1128 [Erwinia amylovora Ea356]CCO81735.1 hypothetical protein BN433_1142 [Erwinia amylovora Ea266]CCO85538.1 hypothetical protein BN434_1128 [Erwinia a